MHREAIRAEAEQEREPDTRTNTGTKIGTPRTAIRRGSTRCRPSRRRHAIGTEDHGIDSRSVLTSADSVVLPLPPPLRDHVGGPEGW